MSSKKKKADGGTTPAAIEGVEDPAAGAAPPETGLPPVRELAAPSPARTFNGLPIPDVATHFRVRRVDVGGGTKEHLSFGQRDGVVVSEWPISEISGPELLRRHGPGTYRVVWTRHAPDGHVTVLPGRSRNVELKAGIEPPPPGAIDAGAGTAAPPGTWRCCGVPWPETVNFCAMCGKGKSAAQGGGISSLVGGDLLAGIQLAMSLMRETRQTAESEADRRLERERQDFEMRIARERHQYEMDMRAQQARHEMMMRDAGKSPDVDAGALARQFPTPWARAWTSSRTRSRTRPRKPRRPGKRSTPRSRLCSGS